MELRCNEYNKAILRVIGLWPYPHERGTFRGRLYNLLTNCLSLNVIVTFFFMVSGVNPTRIKALGLKEACEIGLQYITGIVFVTKLGTLVQNVDRIQHVKKLLDEEFSLETEEEKRIINRCARHERRVTKTLSWFIHLTVVAFYVGIAIKTIKSHRSGDTSTYKLAMSYFLEPQTFTEFILIFTHLAITLTLLAQISSLADCVLWAFLKTIEGHMDIIAMRIRTLQLPSETEKLKTIIKRHLKLMRFRDDLQSIFKPVLAVQFFLTSIMICLSLFQITHEHSSIAMLLKNIIYLVLKLGQLYMHCWYGQKLIDKSYNIGQEIYYSTKWYENPTVESKRLVQMVILRSQKPLTMAVGVFPVSNETFRAVLDSSISYFIFLKTINSHLQGSDSS